MESSISTASRGPLTRLGTAMAIGLGVVLGSLLRELPVSTATIVYRPDPRPSNDDAAIACAIAALPDAIGGLVVFGLIVVFIAGSGAICGSVLVAQGLRRGTPAGLDPLGTGDETSGPRTATRFGQVMVGTALAAPAVWLLAGLVTSL